MIHRPAGYEPATLPLRHPAVDEEERRRRETKKGVQMIDSELSKE